MWTLPYLQFKSKWSSQTEGAGLIPQLSDHSYKKGTWTYGEPQQSSVDGNVRISSKMFHIADVSTYAQHMIVLYLAVLQLLDCLKWTKQVVKSITCYDCNQNSSPAVPKLRLTYQMSNIMQASLSYLNRLIMDHTHDIHKKTRVQLFSTRHDQASSFFHQNFKQTFFFF